MILILGWICMVSGIAQTAKPAPPAVPFPPSNWRPWMGAPAGDQYVAPTVCIGCHSSEASTQLHTPMAHAAEDIQTTTILNQHPHLEVRNGPWLVRIDRKGDQSLYSITDGKQTLAVPILWAFGLGDAGQTYVYQLQGAYYESRFSFFNDTQRLGLTMGYTADPPKNIEDALGRRLSPDETHQCFGCHTSDDLRDGRLKVTALVPGVSCQNCHGPGAQHVAAMKAHNFSNPHIINPAKMDAGTISDFCGSCHRTSLKVLSMALTGVRNVRFQPYRLEMSRCWDPTDARISCLACHDPHLNLVTKTSAYDSKCLACHVTRGRHTTAAKPGPACPRATANCVSCHMPRVEIPGSHFKFTDHNIRIVRKGEPYPD